MPETIPSRASAKIAGFAHSHDAISPKGSAELLPVPVDTGMYDPPPPPELLPPPELPPVLPEPLSDPVDCVLSYAFFRASGVAAFDLISARTVSFVTFFASMPRYAAFSTKKFFASSIVMSEFVM